MAEFNQAFDATQVDPTPRFEPLPAGEYAVIITESHLKPTKVGTGQYLELHLTVLDGPFKGRLLFDRLNLIHPNPQAVDIAQRALSQICHAVGQLQVSDSSQLHGKPLRARVKYRAAEGVYDATNEVAGYQALADGPASAPSAVFPAQAKRPVPASPSKQAEAAASRPPWARR